MRHFFPALLIAGMALSHVCASRSLLFAADTAAKSEKSTKPADAGAKSGKSTKPADTGAKPGSSLKAVDPSEVDKVIPTELEKRHIPGLSMAIVIDGKVVLERGYGQASLELAVPAKPETVYQIGSVTKQFTATAVMLMVRDGKVALEDRISKHLSGLPAAWADVTIRHLLTHTSGVPSYTELPDFEKSQTLDFTHEEMIRRVADLPLKFKPGEDFSYSNTGYYLLGMLLEKVSGKTYGELLEARIFKPLEMKSTRANDPYAILPNRAAGYGYNPTDGVFNADRISMTQPFSAGMLVSTVQDLARWDAALYGERVLKKAELDQMWTPQKRNNGNTVPYGFGWGLEPMNGHRLVAHGGGIPGFSSVIMRFVDDRLTLIAIANIDGAPLQRMLRGVAALYMPDVAERTEAIEDTDPKLSRRLEQVLRATAQGTLDPAELTEELATQLFPDRIKGAQGFLADQGALKSFTLVERQPRDDAMMYRYAAVFEKMTLRAIFVVRKDGKIAGMRVMPD